MYLMSLLFGQRFRSSKQFDSRSDQVVAFELERPELDIPSSSVAVVGLFRPSLILKEKETMNYEWETEGVPLFASSTLNTSGIEWSIEVLEGFRGQR